MDDDTVDGPILVDQTKVPKSSLFEARDAESAVQAAEDRLQPPPTDHSDDNSVTEDLSDEFEMMVLTTALYRNQHFAAAVDARYVLLSFSL